MGWARILQKNQLSAPYFEEIGRNKALLLTKSNDEQLYRLSVQGDVLKQLSPLAARLVIRAEEHGPSNLLEMYLVSRILGEGAKIFTPGSIDLDALEEMTLNIDFNDYAQPFDIVIIDLPKDYMARHETDCDPNELHPGNRHQPECLVVVHVADKAILICNVLFTSGQCFKLVLNGGTRPENQIEDELIRAEGLGEYVDSLKVLDTERVMCYRIMRAGLNACLLFDEAGVKRVGYSNQKHAERLKDYIAKGQKVGKDTTKQRLELRTMPVYYELKQEVELYKHATTESEGNGKGSKVGPHRRRGYYKMQHHGPGNTLRKRIRIPSTLVNWHLFVGNQRDATSFYHYRPEKNKG